MVKVQAMYLYINIYTYIYIYYNICNIMNIAFQFLDDSGI